MSDNENSKIAEELAVAHWGYVLAVLSAHHVSPSIIEQCGFHYQAAFVHGFKHGVEFCAEPEKRL